MQQHGSKYFARHPPPPQTLGVKRSKFNFFRTWSCFISNQMQSRNVATWSQIFCLKTAPPLTLGLVSKGVSSTLLERGHVEYQIKGNHECIDIVANTLRNTPPPPPHTHTHTHSLTLGVWNQQVKSQLFQNMVMSHIKLKGIMNSATRLQIC